MGCRCSPHGSSTVPQREVRARVRLTGSYPKVPVSHSFLDRSIMSIRASGACWGLLLLVVVNDEWVLNGSYPTPCAYRRRDKEDAAHLYNRYVSTQPTLITPHWRNWQCSRTNKVALMLISCLVPRLLKTVQMMPVAMVHSLTSFRSPAFG